MSSRGGVLQSAGPRVSERKQIATRNLSFLAGPMSRRPRDRQRLHMRDLQPLRAPENMAAMISAHITPVLGKIRVPHISTLRCGIASFVLAGFCSLAAPAQAAPTPTPLVIDASAPTPPPAPANYTYDSADAKSPT